MAPNQNSISKDRLWGNEGESERSPVGKISTVFHSPTRDEVWVSKPPTPNFCLFFPRKNVARPGRSDRYPALMKDFVDITIIVMRMSARPCDAVLRIAQVNALSGMKSAVRLLTLSSRDTIASS